MYIAILDKTVYHCTFSSRQSGRTSSDSSTVCASPQLSYSSYAYLTFTSSSNPTGHLTLFTTPHSGSFSLLESSTTFDQMSPTGCCLALHQFMASRRRHFLCHITRTSCLCRRVGVFPTSEVHNRRAVKLEIVEEHEGMCNGVDHEDVDHEDALFKSIC